MNYFAAIGLLFDITGTIVVFYYGLPSKIVSTKTVPAFEGDEFDRKEKEIEESNEKVKKTGTTGLRLIGVGFIFQFMGVIIPSQKPEDVKCYHHRHAHYYSNCHIHTCK